jgi:hypothetical protein
MRDDLGWKAVAFILGGSIFSHADRLCPDPHQPVKATPPLEQHATLRGANQKLKRLSVLISNLHSYLVQNTTSIVDYCHRYWSGQPISSSPAESAANSLVNARMNKKRQMRWSLAGAHRVLQVRAAVADGRLKQAKFALAA